MSLVRCKECGAQISTLAESCPGCGAKQSKSSGRLKAFFLLVVVLAAGNVIFGVNSPSKRPSQSEPEKTPEEIRRAEDLKKREDRAFAFGKAIRQHAREPDSVDFIQMFVSNDGNVACAEYRAKNGFGGMTIERAVMTGSKFTTEASSWSKHCKNGMNDTIYMVK